MPATTPPAVPSDLPIGIDPSDTDTDADPPLEDERADGGEPRQQAQRMPFGIGSDEDPFARLREQLGVSTGEPETTVVPQPGSTQALTEEALARKGTTEYPDDMLVTVKLWEVNDAGVAGDPILVAHNVLYSTAKEPLTWIEYGGKWYMELVQPETKKKLVRKTFVTRGDPAPKNWRPRIGGDEMDETKLATALVLALRGTGMVTQQQGMPPGAVPQGIYDGSTGDLRAQVAELKTENKALQVEKEREKDAKVDAVRKQDLAERDLKQSEKEVRALTERVRDLEAKLSARPQGEKPDWAYIMEFIEKRGDGAIKPSDLLKLFSELKSDKGPDQFTTLNNALDLVEKTKRAAGVQGPGAAAGEGDTLNKILGLADKAASLVQGRQRLVEIERGGRPPAQQQPQGQQQPVEQTPEELDKVALERTLKRVETAFREKWNPVRVGQMLAASVVWAGTLELADADPDVKGFMARIVQDPDKWLVWYAQNLDPQMEGPEEYGKAVSEAFKAAMHLRAQPQPKPSDGGNGKPVAQQTPVEQPQAVATPPVEPQSTASTPPPAEAETVATVPDAQAPEAPKAN